MFWTMLMLVAAGFLAGLTWPSATVSQSIKIIGGVVLVPSAATFFFSADGARKRKTQAAALSLGLFGVAQLMPDSRATLVLVILASFVMCVSAFEVPRSVFAPYAPTSK